jgi:hypothetical protein
MLFIRLHNHNTVARFLKAAHKRPIKKGLVIICNGRGSAGIRPRDASRLRNCGGYGKNERFDSGAPLRSWEVRTFGEKDIIMLFLGFLRDRKTKSIRYSRVYCQLACLNMPGRER